MQDRLGISVYKKEVCDARTSSMNEANNEGDNASTSGTDSSLAENPQVFFFFNFIILYFKL